MDSFATYSFSHRIYPLMDFLKQQLGFRQLMRRLYVDLPLNKRTLWVNSWTQITPDAGQSDANFMALTCGVAFYPESCLE